jgi:hypothetical protein
VCGLMCCAWKRTARHRVVMHAKGAVKRSDAFSQAPVQSPKAFGRERLHGVHCVSEDRLVCATQRSRTNLGSQWGTGGRCGLDDPP